MQPPAGDTCGTYLNAYATSAGGSIYNPDATADCQYCSVSTADQFLQSVAIRFSTRWRDYGLGFAYIAFNIFMAVFLYYLFRVRKSSGKSLKQKLGLGGGKKKQKAKQQGSEQGKRESVDEKQVEETDAGTVAGTTANSVSYQSSAGSPGVLTPPESSHGKRFAEAELAHNGREGTIL